MFTGLVLIGRSPYLLTMCAYMLLFTVTSTFLAFEQARIVKATLTEASARVSYLGTIDLLVNVITLFTQLFFTGRILSRLGVTAGLLLLPIVTIGGFAWLLAAPTTLALMVVQVGRRGLHYAVDRPTREVLYTVLGPEEKYKSKSFIDTFVYRGGDLLGAWTDDLLNKAGIAVATTAIVVSLVWASAGFTLGAPESPHRSPRGSAENADQLIRQGGVRHHHPIGVQRLSPPPIGHHASRLAQDRFERGDVPHLDPRIHRGIDPSSGHERKPVRIIPTAQSGSAPGELFVLGPRPLTQKY